MNSEISLILHKAKVDKGINSKYLKALRLHNKSVYLNELKNIHEGVFSKTDCLECANCCKTTPPIIKQNDITRIAKYLGDTTKQFAKKYVITDVDGTMVFNVVPCRFLAPNNKCQIYDVRPEACKSYPHTDDDAYFSRTTLNINNTMVCHAAYTILERLKNSLPIEI